MSKSTEGAASQYVAANYKWLMTERETLKAQQKELRDGLVKSVQYINQLASMVNTLKPRGVHAEDFTEHALTLLQRIKC